MSSQTIFAAAGTTSVVADILLVQNAGSVAPGDPILGLAFGTTNLQAYYRIPPAGSVTAITLATQTVGGAYSSGGFVQLDSVHMPGAYRLDIPNACFAATGECNIMISGAAAGTAGTLEPHFIKCIVGDAMGVSAALIATVPAESLPAVASVPTIGQAIYGTYQRMVPSSRSITGTTETVTKVNGSTALCTFTLNSSSSPTSVVRAT
jgi:hypothetical protein